MNLDILTADVIGDIAIVIGVSSLLGAVARRLGQPTVVGQIVAGIALGPSLLGRLPGHLTTRLFTHAAVPYLSVISQVAVVIFMFTVGYEIDFRPLRGRGRAAPLIAASALLVPLALGMGVAVLGRHALAAIGETHTDSRSFVLFMGVAISVTALPVLASIVRERGLAGTTVGTIATAAAGIMDVAAWLVLAAALVGTAAAGSRSWPVTVALLAGFVVLMLVVVRPALRWWIRRPGTLLSNQVPLALVLVLASAWVTSSLGLHPVFGAFLAGLTMPGRDRDDAPDADVLRTMEQAGGLLLPIFFVVTGLTINIGALNGSDLILLLIIVACAMLGKIGPAYAAARVSRLERRQSAMIATLVNTRGLTELIALNVGLSAGIIHQRLFTILVLMALITTIATGPLISAIGQRTQEDLGADQRLREETAHADVDGVS
ncbi:MAG TPA: cation:proton antiporter [Streptosporangiaceae bacterium]|nr:cation:proton antiporter [Streptosporangiaceae bacterium]